MPRFCRARLGAAGFGAWLLLVLPRAAPAQTQDQEEGRHGHPGRPQILDCTSDADFEEFRLSLQRNAELGYPMEDHVFAQADRLISKNLITFLEFHRSKSNEFFHDCVREEPRGVVCIYGMLSAFLIHNVYLRHRFQVLGDRDTDAEQVLRHSTDMARLLLINKNNCLDFLDSAGWPFKLKDIIKILSPVEAAEETFAASRERLEGAAPAWAWWPGHDLRAEWVPQRHAGARLVTYITGTHVALVREPADMLRRFVGPMMGCEFVPVIELVDDQHCSFLGCGQPPADGGEGAPSAAAGSWEGVDSYTPVGLRELAVPRFRPRWAGLDIMDMAGLVEEFRALFARHPLRHDADILMCTTPAVLCTLLLGFDKPLLAYLGEPLLLSVEPEDHTAWFAQFEAMVSDGRSFFTCYNPFLSEMIEYQTGLALPTIRLHGLYTDVVYSPTRLNEVLVVKGPNICVDPSCLLNRFSVGCGRPRGGGEEADGIEPGCIGQENAAKWATAGQPIFVALDELGGAPYATLASFRAAIIYPYDVALAIFYEFYSMGMPLLLPSAELMRFYVFRGLHSAADYHKVQRSADGEGGFMPGAGLGPAPFLPPMGVGEWFSASAAWAARTDFAKWPHLIRFGSVPELLALLAPGATDWAGVSASMKRFNEETLLRSVAQWAAGVGAALDGRAGVHRRPAAQ